MARCSSTEFDTMLSHLENPETFTNHCIDNLHNGFIFLTSTYHSAAHVLLPHISSDFVAIEDYYEDNQTMEVLTFEHCFKQAVYTHHLGKLKGPHHIILFGKTFWMVIQIARR